MDPNQISIISAIIAFISAIIAYSSYRVARRALLIEEKRVELYSKSINCELVRAVHIKASKEVIVYIFIISISNSSSSNKSLSNILLNILYTDQSNYNRKAIFQHDPNLADEFNLKDYEFAPKNPFLKPHQTDTYSFIFKVNKELVQENYIDVFRLDFQESNGHVTSIESILTTPYDLNKEEDNEANN